MADAATSTPTLAAASRDLGVARALDGMSSADAHLELRIGATGLWVTTGLEDRPALALRPAHAPSGLVMREWERIDDGWESRLDSDLGVFGVVVRIVDGVLSLRTTLEPSGPFKVTYWPRDLFPLGPDGLPQSAEGLVHFTQRGPRTGLVYGQLDDPALAFLYHQDLTALNRYCRIAKASVADTVGGEWPELGFSLPRGQDPLPEGERHVISSVFVALGDAEGEDIGQARLFLDLLARTYLQISRPRAAYRDWPGTVSKTLEDLGRDECWEKVGGERYLNAYYGDHSSPPESMVQLAVLLPLIEYEEWQEGEVPLTRVLRSGLDGFWDEKIGALGRWHRDAIDELGGEEPHKHPRVMDSWYLYHPLLNLSRLALKGDEDAKELFLDSLSFVNEVAHHFEYRWPVFYDLDTLDVIKAETAPGEGGENDVAGLHAHLMLQAWKVTGDQKYLEEARAAADTLEGLGFDLAYQMNNTIFAMTALKELALETGEDKYAGLSDLCLANVFTNLFLWECDYGAASHYPTFFGVFPLVDAPYTAAYEEVEAVGALDHYLRLGNGDLPDRHRILLPEMIRYLLNRGLFYFPQMLPPEIISESPSSGEISRDVWLPLEDLYEGDAEAGQVGQEIYGAGEPFGLIVRHYWPVRDRGVMVYCDYPIDDFEADDDGVRFHIIGDERFSCEVRLIPLDSAAATVATLEEASPPEGVVTGEGHRLYEVAAGQTIAIRFA